MSLYYLFYGIVCFVFVESMKHCAFADSLPVKKLKSYHVMSSFWYVTKDTDSLWPMVSEVVVAYGGEDLLLRSTPLALTSRMPASTTPDKVIVGAPGACILMEPRPRLSSCTWLSEFPCYRTIDRYRSPTVFFFAFTCGFEFLVSLSVLATLSSKTGRLVALLKNVRTSLGQMFRDAFP